MTTFILRNLLFQVEFLLTLHQALLNFFALYVSALWRKVLGKDHTNVTCSHSNAIWKETVLALPCEHSASLNKVLTCSMTEILIGDKRIETFIRKKEL